MLGKRNKFYFNHEILNKFYFNHENIESLQVRQVEAVLAVYGGRGSFDLQLVVWCPDVPGTDR